MSIEEKARKEIKAWMKANGETMHSLSEKAGKGRSFITNALSMNRGYRAVHRAVLWTQDIVPYTPDVIDWAKKEHRIKHNNSKRFKSNPSYRPPAIVRVFKINDLMANPPG